jgi:hypothetical protein
MWTPSRISATRSRPSSGAACHARSCAVVFATNRRRTLLFARPSTYHTGRDWLQIARILAGRHTHQHLLDDAAIQPVATIRGEKDRWHRGAPVKAVRKIPMV